jgi:hypothetical protein
MATVLCSVCGQLALFSNGEECTGQQYRCRECDHIGKPKGSKARRRPRRCEPEPTIGQLHDQGWHFRCDHD